MKRKANISIELQGLKCDHQVWPWPWPWPWIFKVKYRISYISAKSGPIATKWKTNISIELQASNVTNGFDLDHNLDLWILKVNCDLHLWPHTWPWSWISWSNFEIAVSQNGRADWHCIKGVAVGHHDHDHDHLVTKVRCMDLPDSDRGDFSCQHAVNSFSSRYFSVCVGPSSPSYPHLPPTTKKVGSKVNVWA